MTCDGWLFELPFLGLGWGFHGWAGWVVLLAVGLAGNAWSADGTKVFSPTTRIAKTSDEVPFSGGMLEIPTQGRTNNRGIILQQTVPGQTHIDTVLHWRYLEPEKGQWDHRELDEMLALSRSKGLKTLVMPSLGCAPAWFKQTRDYTPLAEMRTGKTVDMLSPWAPGTVVAFDYFYGELARRYRDQVAIIKFAYPGSDFGEVGLLMGAKCFLPGGPAYRSFPQDPAAWKAGYWCGDPYARTDFREQMLRRYADLSRLNAAWGTRFATPEAIEFPDPDQRVAQRLRWLDFMTWLQDSQTRNMVKFLRVIRKHFSDILIEVPLGYGSDMPNQTGDRTALCRAAADFMPASIRSTHGSFNRPPARRAYWFYKRMAPVCNRLGVGFGAEPPGGDLKADELLRQYFEDASAGVNLVFHYFQNYHIRPDVVGEYKRLLRPQERSLVDIGVLYPSTQMLLDMSGFPGWPGGQIQFCDLGREYFDYDVVDENMIGWGMLKGYKVLLHTSGVVYRQSTLKALTGWLSAGGILVTHGTPQWEDWAGRKEVVAGWTTDEDPSAAQPGVRVYRVGKGRLYAAETTGKIPDYLSKVVAILTATANAPLHGFDGKDDGKYVTDFPEGRLVFDIKTLVTEFIPKTP